MPSKYNITKEEIQEFYRLRVQEKNVLYSYRKAV